MSLNEERCPKCFSKFSDNKWTNDPILTKNGAKFVYDEGSGLLIPETDIKKRRYKGCSIIKNKHIKELQDANNENKPTAGWTPVQGESEDCWIPNKKHIKELRETIEKGLGITETTTPSERTIILEQYFNYDEEGTERQVPHQLEWIDPNLTDKIWRGNISHVHIEDLRKIISIWIEQWNITPPQILISQPLYTPNMVWISPFTWWFESHTYNHLLGDKGDWNVTYVEQAKHFGNIVPPSPPPNTVSIMGYQEFILDLTNESSSFYCGGTSIANKDNMPPPLTGVGSGGSTHRISFPYGGGGATFYKIKNKSRLKFNASFSLTYTNASDSWYGLPPPRPYVYCSIRYTKLPLAQNTLYYIYGDYPIESIGFRPFENKALYLSQNEFQNFDRNIYDDIFLKYGSHPIDGGIVEIRFFLSLMAFASPTSGQRMDGELLIDNIKFFNRV